MKKATCVDASKFTIKVDSASLKLDVEELDVDKLKSAPVDLHLLSNIVDSDVNKKWLWLMSH